MKTRQNPAPTLERIKAYEFVTKVVKERGHQTPAQLKAQLAQQGLCLPSRMTLRRWSQGQNKPSSGLNTFNPAPSDELGFFLAAWIGDGWGDEADGGKRMRLKVRSKSFAEEFARCATRILSKREPYRVWTTRDEGGEWYNVKVTSISLYGYVTQGLESLESVASQCAVGFLRGIYTAEGGPVVSVSSVRTSRLDVGVWISNTDVALLEFTRALVLGRGLAPGRIKINRQAGESTNLARVGRTERQFSINRLSDVEVFSRLIRFADTRKQKKLEDALALIRQFGPFDSVSEWMDLYEKRGRIWVPKDVRNTGATSSS